MEEIIGFGPDNVDNEKIKGQAKRHHDDAIDKRSAPVLEGADYLLQLYGGNPHSQSKIHASCEACKLPIWWNDPGLRITRDMIRCAACDAAVQTLKAACGVNKWPTEEFKQLDPKTKANCLPPIV